MKKWYKKPITKAILVFVAIVTAILLGISVILLASLNGVVYDAKLRAEKKYENAKSFEQTMYQTATYVAERIHIQDEFETDGKYNPDKIVDITEYAKNRTMPGATENTAHMFIICPFSAKDMQQLFSTHPSTADRVARLRAQAKAMRSSGGAK